MDYEHDDRRAADVPGANGAEGSGLPAGREPLDAGLPSNRSPEVRAFDPQSGSGQGPFGLTESGQADDLFDAMFLTGGMRPPAFAAVDHDLGFPPPQAPDLASAFLAALDAIDDRRFVTPVPEEPPAAPIAPAETAAPGEPAYELRPQSRLELESEVAAEPVQETPAQPVIAEDAMRLPWDTARMPVAGLLTTGEIADERAAEPERAAPATESENETWAFASYLEGESKTPETPQAPAEDVEEFASAEDAEPIEQIEESAYYAAGLDDDAGDIDEAEAAAVIAAEADAEAEAVAAAAAQAEAEAEAAAAAAQAEAAAEAEALARAIAEAEQAELEAAIAAEAALDAPVEDDDAADEDAFDGAFDLSVLDASPDESPDAASVAPFDADLTPGDDDFELEPSIGIEPIDAAPMTFDGPDAFAAPVAAAEPEPEPEPESDELEDLQDFVVFSLGDMRCVVPIRNVVEVGRIPDAAPVPNAPAWLYGLGNLRGQVLSLIDLRALFGVGRIKASAGRMVVLRGDEDDITAGVMVDQVHQIVALSPSRFKETPAQLPLPEKSAEYVRGACDYGNFTMIGLHVDGVLGVESLTEETV
jgi:chemotaxis signal transduction protein